MKKLLLLAVLLPLPSFAVDFDRGVDIPSQFVVHKDRWTLRTVSDASHVTGKGIEEMLELVTKTCVIDSCRADNVLRQLRVLAMVPEASWALTADDIAEILEHTDAGVYDHDGNGVHTTWSGHSMTTAAGPHRFVLRSIPAPAWRGFDRRDVEEIVEHLTRQVDRILAISLWMDAHQTAP